MGIDMEPDHKVLDPEQWQRAHRVVAAWKQDPASALSCPRCGAHGLAVEDQSVRPHAEWYRLECGQCDLDVAIHIPQAVAPPLPA